jgi:hypothetical protein
MLRYNDYQKIFGKVELISYIFSSMSFRATSISRINNINSTYIIIILAYEMQP